MKEIGEKLKEARKNNGVSIEEASDDLKINLLELENLENGNYKAFKDIYELKNNIKAYARYLGLDENNILNDFNDFLFEKTSKISLLDIKEAKEEKKDNNKKKISSPYTNIKPSRYNLAPIVLVIVLLVFISLVVYLCLKVIRHEDVKHELKSQSEVCYEFTK